MLIQCITDADIFGLSDKEGMKYVDQNIGQSASQSAEN
jgi:hypothetical protein